MIISLLDSFLSFEMNFLLEIIRTCFKIQMSSNAKKVRERLKDAREIRSPLLTKRGYLWFLCGSAISPSK